MSAIVERERLIGDVARLRRAEKTSSFAREDLAPVRANLERMAGPTVTRAVAARLLGVSQTALDRWIAAGDVPVLITPTGRHELPLRWLVESIEAVQDRRLANPDDRHPLGFKTTLIYADYAPSAREAEWVEAAFASEADALAVPEPAAASTGSDK
ncbi:MAG TPA: hypothetical protein VNY31_08750 [Solirubrobacteraceae bacterium]|jgi:hypothetical protein|nr:hypothetical protein [Solirubrobacteraceae bacterium]